jgi:glycosyltransferase involved in cell wall biosynthesis
MMPRPRRLVAIGHSYVVANNRRFAHELARQGHGRWDVTVVAPRRFRGDLHRIAASLTPGEPVDLRVLDVRFDRSPHLMWYRDLQRVLASDWDVVHCWEEPYVLAGAQIARAATARARLILTSFQNLSKRYPWPLSAFERSTMHRADGWVAFGETVRSALVSRPGYADKPHRTIPPGVDVEQFRPDPVVRRRMLDRLGWSTTDRVVGFVGRFVPEKGIGVLLRALAAARTPWRALFVGGGPLAEDISKAAERFPGRVHVVTASHDEVPAWLNAMTVLCAPSQTTSRWREQFGRMLVEAMACGVPVVASVSGEIPFVVGSAGRLLVEADAQQWADALDALLDDQEACQQLGAQGLARAHERFAWPVVARSHLAFAEELLDARTSVHEAPPVAT